jgi:hypothetical protein
VNFLVSVWWYGCGCMRRPEHCVVCRLMADRPMGATVLEQQHLLADLADALEAKGLVQGQVRLWCGHCHGG